MTFVRYKLLLRLFKIVNRHNTTRMIAPGARPPRVRGPRGERSEPKQFCQVFGT